jgi:hypothetical protein
MLHILSDGKNVKEDDLFFEPIAIKNAIEDVKHDLDTQQTEIIGAPGIPSNTNSLNPNTTSKINSNIIPNTNLNTKQTGGSRNRKLTRKH